MMVFVKHFLSSATAIASGVLWRALTESETGAVHGNRGTSHFTFSESDFTTLAF
jgi:hypothetical protein